jgi:hypothetical protein
METHYYTVYQPTFETQEQCSAYAIQNALSIRDVIADHYNGDPIKFETGYCAREDMVKKLLEQTKPFIQGESA